MSTPDSKHPGKPAGQPLSELRRGAVGRVVAVLDHNHDLGEHNQSTIAQRLLEIGFAPGERCEIIGETWPGGDPIAVRIGSSTFALRRQEASAVLIELDSPYHS